MNLGTKDTDKISLPGTGKKSEEKTKAELEECFDEIFATQTCSEVLNAALTRLANNKTELLLVLDRPDVPLHNNLSEGDIREYVKKRKISGGTDRKSVV